MVIITVVVMLKFLLSKTQFKPIIDQRQKNQTLLEILFNNQKFCFWRLSASLLILLQNPTSLL
jgi:hypothetical protein